MKFTRPLTLHGFATITRPQNLAVLAAMGGVLLTQGPTDQARPIIPKAWDDRIVRSRLRQAFGRLIRRASDRGVFVLLDRGAPSRLMSAFPEGVVVQRVGLAKAVEETRSFLHEQVP